MKDSNDKGREEAEQMSEEKKKKLEDFIEIVDQLDPVSFLLMQNNAKVLLARDQLERERMAGKVSA